MTGSGSGPFNGDDGGALEALLALEESTIRDDGFSTGVKREISRDGAARRLTLYSAGMLGFGVAAGSLSKAASDSPAFAEWVHSLDKLMTSSALSNAVEGAPIAYAVAAAVACVSLVGLMFAAQGR